MSDEDKKNTAMFVKSAIRKYINAEGFMISKDVLDGDILNGTIKKLLDLAMDRAKTKNLKTIKSIHLRGLVGTPSNAPKKKKH